MTSAKCRCNSLSLTICWINQELLFPLRVRRAATVAIMVWPLLLFLSAIAFTGCAHPNQTQAHETLRRALSGEPSTLDPSAAADNFSFEVLRDLYEGLTTDGPQGEVLPGVAESWVISSSGTEYTFQLRQNARWSNGQPVKAQNFVDAWQRVLDPAHGSPIADNLRLIAGAASIITGSASPATLGAYAVSDKVLLVKLDEPAPYFPQLLTHSAAYPMYTSEKSEKSASKDWVSNGPYVLAAWAPGTKIELTKNPDYWDSQNVHISRVEYQFADENSQYARYRAGQLDLTDTVPLRAFATLKENAPQELVVAPFLATSYYGLNLAKRPFADNISLRQALAMAINRKQLVDSMAFGQESAYSFVPPGTWNYSSQSWPWRDLSDLDRVAEARRLYAKAGYTKDQPLHLTLLINSDPVIKNTAIIIAEMWRESLGIDTSLTEEEYRVFLQSRHDKSKWDVARLGWTADYNDASNFLDIFRQHSNNNDTGFSDPSFDFLLDKAAMTPNAKSRRVILEEGERKMLADYPVIPLYFFVSKRLVKPYVHGVRPNPLNRIGSKSLTMVVE